MKLFRRDTADDNCPSKDFTEGVPNGNCWGDGHYLCKKCVHYRSDFAQLGQHFIDHVHNLQGQIQITTIR